MSALLFQKVWHELDSMSDFLKQIWAIILVMYKIFETELNSNVVVFALKINNFCDFLGMSHIFETLVFVSWRTKRSVRSNHFFGPKSADILSRFWAYFTEQYITFAHMWSNHRGWAIGGTPPLSKNRVSACWERSVFYMVSALSNYEKFVFCAKRAANNRTFWLFGGSKRCKKLVT